MNQNATTVRRPIALWLIVISFTLVIVLNFGLQIYLRFWSSHRFTLAARYADWTLLDFAHKFYPGLLILAGCAGLLMLRRWAAYVFGLLLLLRMSEAMPTLFRDDWEGNEMLLLVPLVAVVPAAVGFGYALHLARKGVLRSGVC